MRGLLLERLMAKGAIHAIGMGGGMGNDGGNKGGGRNGNNGDRGSRGGGGLGGGRSSPSMGGERDGTDNEATNESANSVAGRQNDNQASENNNSSNRGGIGGGREGRRGATTATAGVPATTTAETARAKARTAMARRAEEAVDVDSMKDHSLAQTDTQAAESAIERASKDNPQVDDDYGGFLNEKEKSYGLTPHEKQMARDVVQGATATVAGNMVSGMMPNVKGIPGTGTLATKAATKLGVPDSIGGVYGAKTAEDASSGLLSGAIGIGATIATGNPAVGAMASKATDMVSYGFDDRMSSINSLSNTINGQNSNTPSNQNNPNSRGNNGGNFNSISSAKSAMSPKQPATPAATNQPFASANIDTSRYQSGLLGARL